MTGISEVFLDERANSLSGDSGREGIGRRYTTRYYVASSHGVRSLVSYTPDWPTTGACVVSTAAARDLSRFIASLEKEPVSERYPNAVFSIAGPQ